MFGLINSRLSIGVRSGMIAACAAPPIALLLFLFVAKVTQDIDATSRELSGATYIGEIWVALLPGGVSSDPAPPAAPPRADDPRNIGFHTVAEAKAFAAASGDSKVADGVTLIRAVGDGSGLTLDGELDSYYAMDAATVKLPRLMEALVAVSHAAGREDRAFAMGQVVNFADATAYDMRQAIRHDDTGRARAVLTPRAAALAMAVGKLRTQTDASTAPSATVQRLVDQTWRANRAELIQMLRARQARLQAQLAVNLVLVIVSLGCAAMLMVATARGMTGRLRGLLRTMDRLNDGDTDVEIPYLTDSNETGRIAKTLQAFKRGLINSVEERRRVEASNLALRQSEERYRLLADNVTDIILRFDLDGRIVYASPSVRRYGYRPEGLIGGLIGANVHPGDVALARQSFADVAEGRPGRRTEWRARTADGGSFWVESWPAPILDEAGTLVGILAVMRNVDERKAAERALREANAELMRVARVSALGAFASSIAHEINQPLAAVVSNSEAAMRWLAKVPANIEEAVEALGRVARDALRASEVVGRMRSLVTKQEPVYADFQVNDAIREVLTLTQREQHNLDVEASLSLTDGDSTIHGDRIQFQQVILNLVLNAIEAMRETPSDEKRLTIRTSLTDDGAILVEVEDGGAGIDADAADHIFEHLFTTKVGGTGLGLAIAKSIIEAHGGRIWAEPAIPRGAIFKLSVPTAAHRAAGARV